MVKTKNQYSLPVSDNLILELLYLYTTYTLILDERQERKFESDRLGLGLCTDHIRSVKHLKLLN